MKAFLERSQSPNESCLKKFAQHYVQENNFKWLFYSLYSKASKQEGFVQNSTKGFSILLVLRILCAQQNLLLDIAKIIYYMRFADA